MKIECVYVQSENGVPTDEAFHKAWLGFSKRNLPCRLVTQQQIESGELAFAKTTLVVGGIRTVERAMSQIGMPVPTANNLPEELSTYFGRAIERTTLGAIRTTWESGGGKQCFVKPLNTNKGFPAMALFDVDDLQSIANLPDDYAVLVSEYVLFESEWRVFVCDYEIVGLSHYQGDPFRFPNAETVKSAITEFNSAPRAYGIDFGILSTGETVLIECNDGYSLGSYSLNAVDYSRLLESRWMELAGC